MGLHSNSTTLNATDFNVTDENASCETQTQIKWEDRSIFMYMAFGSVGLGLFFAALFHCLVKENPDSQPCDTDDENCELDGMRLPV